MKKTRLEEINQIFSDKRIGKYLVVNKVSDILNGRWECFEESFESITEGLEISKMKPKNLKQEERELLYENFKEMIKESVLDEEIFEEMYKYGYYLKQARLDHLFSERKRNNAVYINPKEAEDLYNEMKRILLMFLQYELKIKDNELQHFYKPFHSIFKHRELSYSSYRTVLKENYFENLSKRLNGEEIKVLKKDYEEIKKTFA